MVLTPVLILLLSTTGPAPKTNRLEAAQRAFVSGDYDAALKLLDPAQESSDPATQEKVQLLRAQCFSARQDFARAEEAFTLALEANPEASLDPTRVDPAVVKMLDGLRARLTGELLVTANAPADITVDGRSLGQAPIDAQVPIGRHKVEAKFGKVAVVSEAIIYAKRPSHASFALAVSETPVAPAAPVASKIRPFGDIRGVSEALTVDGGLELGGGVEFPYVRVGLWARLVPNFGIAPRVALVVPIIEVLNAYLEAELPFAFRPDGTAYGLGGAGGVEFLISRWLGVFAQLGGRHFFSNPDSNSDDRFTAALGVRLRLP